ncbi:MAG: GIY-YIG nuclease family protein [Candidatus Omnitrophica bacterium]|nr:GIY-YIG nuclease family protein [Candidatus Omnitrophota bacterium]
MVKEKARGRQRKFTRSGNFSVYILECRDGSYYAGQTNDLAARLKLHLAGKGSRYVRSRLPFTLGFVKTYRYFKRAFHEELRIKGLSRKEKEKLVKNFCQTKRTIKGGYGKEKQL